MAPRRAASAVRPVLLAVGFASFATLAVARVRLGDATGAGDFLQPGTQPGELLQPVAPAWSCSFCHGQYDPEIEPYGLWRTSLMAQAMRDPLFHACLAIAEQDAPLVGDLCLRCHAPSGWLEGRATPTDGSALAGSDFDGVSCNVCHRMVDPEFKWGISPEADRAILASLEAVPAEPHNGNYVIDPFDRRRGPFDLGLDFPWHEWLESPFHRQAELCATCHDVSNPAFMRVGSPVPSLDDVYVLNAKGSPHPTQKKADQFPLERTYSEWSQSEFAQGPVPMGGRFGGNQGRVSTCQDCHMPRTSGAACAPGFGAVFRNDLPSHGFRGAATWVLRAVRWLDQNHALYGAEEESGLTDAEVEAAIAENVDFLRRAADLELARAGRFLRVRIVNQAGHKLPTGYAEGRRMWIHARFFDATGALLAEHGAYDPLTARLDEASTKVYEAKLGLDEAMAALTGLPVGPSFRFAIVNKVFKDNRIPPRGFTNAGFAAVQAAPVGAAYADGQHWDDTNFAIPPRARSAKATVFYQSSSREYVEFLRDENRTNAAGRVAYEAWLATGMGAPVAIAEASIDF